jgi:PBSX family phage terminase large subunit
MAFKKTNIQKRAINILAGPSRHAMLYGGSRSGKTAIIIYAMIVRAIKVKSRHLVCRLKFNHAKTSIWLDTLPKILGLAFPDLEYEQNKSDFYLTFPNGSEIWVAGLDDKERVEKILGREFSTAFFNEASQIPYSSVTMALTRLAEKNDLKKRAWYDENPPTKRHWTYPLFIKGLQPENWEPLRDPQNYSSMVMNPTDNIDNIDPDYITDVLEGLPEKEKARFMRGEFTDDSNGNIYYAFKREFHVAQVERLPSIPITVGMDFNVSPFTAVICQIVNGHLYVLDEVYLLNSNTNEMAQHLKAKYPGNWTIIPDSTGKALKTSSAGQTDHSILRAYGFTVPHVQNPFRMDRYNEVNLLLEKNRVTIDPKCVKLIRDLEQVSFKEGTNLPDTKDQSLTHISDALGYLVHWAFPMVKISNGASMFER